MKLDHDEIKKFQQENSQYSYIIKNIRKKNNKTVSGNFSLDPKRVL